MSDFNFYNDGDNEGTTPVEPNGVTVGVDESENPESNTPVEFGEPENPSNTEVTGSYDGTVELGEPEAPVLEAKPDAQGIITLDAAKDYIATCHNEDCENYGIEVPVIATAVDPLVTCGPCGQPITDIVEPPAPNFE